MERGLIEAFRLTSDGYSLDRLIADPDMNAAMADACRKLGLVGDERTWNHTLFRLRKAGKLVGIPTQRRTEFSWQECDPYLFASEIALQQMLERGFKSLDEILCDPQVASEFDQCAQNFAPRRYSPLQYRWAALKLRKEAKFAHSRGYALKSARLNAPIAIDNKKLKDVPNSAGVYLIVGCDHKDNLYVGETLNLRERLQYPFAAGWKSSLMARATSMTACWKS